MRMRLKLIVAAALCSFLCALAAAQGASADAPSATAATTPAAAIERTGSEDGAPSLSPREGENPYGLAALWAQGDAVAKATLLVLLIMSMGSWYVMLTKYLGQRRMHQFHAAVADEGFWQADSVQAAALSLSAQSPFRFIAERGLHSAGKHSGMLGNVDLHTWVSIGIGRATSEVHSRLQDGLAVLATVGSTAPFVGLFGTVWGIYNALVKIGMSGQASIDKVAAPVGESLIMTALGLAVAVPAVLGYNWLVRRNKVVMEGIDAFGQDLHAVLMTSGK